MEKDALIQLLLERNAELEKQFNIEKDAKNEAYDCIISNGHFNDYRTWNAQHRGENHQLNCVMGLMAYA